MLYRTVRASENNTTPFEVSLDASIPQHLHRACFLDDSNKRNFKNPGANPDLDASHARKRQKIVLNLILLICPFCGGDRLYDQSRGQHSKDRKHIGHKKCLTPTGLCCTHNTWISSFLMTLMTREVGGDDSGTSVSIGSTGCMLESTCIWSVDVIGDVPIVGSRSTTSFSTSFKTLKTISPSLSLAQDTWKALGHLPFVHCMGAPCALGRLLLQAEHFYTI